MYVVITKYLLRSSGRRNSAGKRDSILINLLNFYNLSWPSSKRNGSTQITILLIYNLIILKFEGIFLIRDSVYTHLNTESECTSVPEFI